MADIDDEISDNVSCDDTEDVDFDVNVDGDDADVHGNNTVDLDPEQDVDDATLFRSFKILRGMCRRLDSQMQSVASRTSNVNPRNVGHVAQNSRSRRGVVIAGSRCNHSYFKRIIASLDERKKNVIVHYGFGNLLEYDGCAVPRDFVQWIADQVDVNCGDILVAGKVIPLSAESVHMVVGVPIGGLDILEAGESGKGDFLGKFKLTSLPIIKSFGNMILKEQLSDEQLFRCFMVVALATFLCPNSSTYPSPKYLSPLVEVSTTAGWDFSNLTYKWIFDQIVKYRNKQRKTLGGCIYFLAVYYLDFLQFGNDTQVIPRSIPRIKVWKGLMVKQFCSLDRVDNKVYGKRPVKVFSDTCYAAGPDAIDHVSNFRERMFSRFEYLPDQVKEHLCSLYEEFSYHQFQGPQFAPDILIFRMFQHLHDTSPDAPAQVNSESNLNHNDHEDTADPFQDEYHNANVFVGPHDEDHRDVDSHNVSTEKVDSDCSLPHSDCNGIGASQATQIIGSSNLVHSDSSMSSSSKKRKRNARSSLSPQASDSIACRTRRRTAESIGKSPLSCIKKTVIEQEVLAGSSGNGQLFGDDGNRHHVCYNDHPESVAIPVQGMVSGSEQNPVDVETLPVLPRKPRGKEMSIREALDYVARKHEEYARKKQLEQPSVSTFAVPEDDSVKDNQPEPLAFIPNNDAIGNLNEVEEGFGSEHEAVGDTSHAGLFSDADRAVGCEGPFFNSPSKPSFRMFDDEDDLGNFISDPNLRRPVGYSAPASMNTSVENSQFSHVFRRFRRKPDLPCVPSVLSNDKFDADQAAKLPFKKSSASYTCVSNVPVSQVHEVGTSNMHNRIKKGTTSEIMNFDALAAQDDECIDICTPPEVLAERVAKHAGIIATPIACRDREGNFHPLSPQPSPDVLFVGERSFQQRCTDLSSSSDQLYNISISSYEGGFGPQGSSGGKLAVHRSKRIPNRSKYRSFPYLNLRCKVYVSHKECDLYDVALDIGESEHGNKYIVDYRNVRVKFFALALSLKPSGKVMSYVMNAWCKKLFKDNHPRQSYKHFFFSSVGDYLVEHFYDADEETRLYKNCKYCFDGAGTARLLYTSNLLFFPIFHLDHWFAVVVDLKGQRYIILESCIDQYGPHSEYHTNIMSVFKRNFYRMWQETGKLDMGISHYDVFFADVPQKTDPLDNGVVIMKCLELWGPMVSLFDKFEASDIRNIRIKILNDMVFCEHNIASSAVSFLKRYDSMIYEKYFKNELHEVEEEFET